MQPVSPAKAKEAEHTWLHSRPSGTPELSVFVSWHTDPFPGLCTWLPPTRFLNCILMKYNSSAEEPRQSAGKQEEGAPPQAIFPGKEPPPRATPGPQPTCQSYYKQLVPVDVRDRDTLVMQC